MIKQIITAIDFNRTAGMRMRIIMSPVSILLMIIMICGNRVTINPEKKHGTTSMSLPGPLANHFYEIDARMAKKPINQITGMELIKNKTLFCELIFALTLLSCRVQTTASKIDSIACCVEFQLSSIGKLDAIPIPVQGAKNYPVAKWTLRIDKELLLLNEHINLNSSDSIKELLEKIDVDSIRVYSIGANQHDYFLVRAQIRAATGLAANFYSWLLIDPEEASIVGFDLMSLSGDARMFHLRDGVLYAVLMNFGDSFF